MNKETKKAAKAIVGIYILALPFVAMFSAVGSTLSTDDLKGFMLSALVLYAFITCAIVGMYLLDDDYSI